MFNFYKYIKHKSTPKHNMPADEEGNAFFEITIKDKSEVIAPFLLDNKDTINIEFANLLDNVAKSVSKKENLHLKLNSQDLSDKEKESFSMAIKNYYHNALIDNKRKLKTNAILICVMLGLSLLTLGFLFIAHFFNFPWIVSEIIDIIAWGFVWESVDLSAFQRTLLKDDDRHDTALYNMKITFNATTPQQKD